jgi:hypothetical protein
MAAPTTTVPTHIVITGGKAHTLWAPTILLWLILVALLLLVGWGIVRLSRRLRAR